MLGSNLKWGSFSAQEPLFLECQICQKVVEDTYHGSYLLDYLKIGLYPHENQCELSPSLSD